MKKSLNVLACTIGASALWGAVTSVSDITKMPVSGTEHHRRRYRRGDL